MNTTNAFDAHDADLMQGDDERRNSERRMNGSPKACGFCLCYPCECREYPNDDDGDDRR